MIKFAVIGTNWITEKFIDGTNNPPENHAQAMKLQGVYSRDIEKAERFAKQHQAPFTFDDLASLATSTEIDAVYIASPNSLHFEQSKLMLAHGKHVICEKPSCSSLEQAQELYQTAKDNNVIFFEAYMTAHLPNFKVIQNNLTRLGKVRKAHIQYCQYSSRYPAYLAGDKPNTFYPEFCNGSIMDIGFYCVALICALFGKPDTIKAQATLLETGVDGCGSVILGYQDFAVTIDHSKISGSSQASEIQGESGSLLIEHVGQCFNIMYQDNKGQNQQTLSQPQSDNSMCYEALAFAEQINQKKINPVYEVRTLQTAQVIQEVRKQTAVIFPSDSQ
ncbi:gfo/Idh/MocA family oxidoreductase [Psychromonas sp. B3M02]|uniref:Gfo/Idh/MocA family protein n=1 Tax=Psychromonas sp. B3M02 TaxID=2267226 RepID=UPI000DEAE2F3|nr:Gfo/Idh/MocA family oxidoreductase [Psychromonas sp. B3M02]RBW47259.1 gfo/Idh/MocA family oxidoreductase [Psychromonas sp. B3M02]